MSRGQFRSLYILQLAVFVLFVLAQITLLLISRDEWLLRVSSVFLLTLVIVSNWISLRIYKPSTQEWQMIVQAVGTVGGRWLLVGSVINLLVFWPNQYKGWNGMTHFVQEVGLFLLLLIGVGWVVSVWLGVKLYALLLYKLGEAAIERKPLFGLTSDKPATK